MSYGQRGCRIPCESVEYTVTKSLMGRNACRSPAESGCIVYVFFDRNRIREEKEYRLMDASAIVSATGGSLGLFLGFSFYGSAVYVGQAITQLYKKAVN